MTNSLISSIILVLLYHIQRESDDVRTQMLRNERKAFDAALDNARVEFGTARDHDPKRFADTRFRQRIAVRAVGNMGEFFGSIMAVDLQAAGFYADFDFADLARSRRVVFGGEIASDLRTAVEGAWHELA